MLFALIRVTDGELFGEHYEKMQRLGSDLSIRRSASRGQRCLQEMRGGCGGPHTVLRHRLGRIGRQDQESALSSIVLEGHTDEVWSLAISADGRWLVTGSTDHTARLWDLNRL